MHDARRGRRTRIWHFHAPAALAATLLIAVPLAPVAFAQGAPPPDTSQTPTPTTPSVPTATPDAATAPADATPPNATTSTSVAPNTVAPNTVAPNTVAPNTMAPNTMAPNTMAPNTMAPNTMAPNTTAPNAAVPSPTATPTAPGLAEPRPGEPSVGSAELPEDLSPWAMFLNADLVVKAVILGLAFASLVTWTVWLAKTIELRKARVEVRDGLRILANAATLAQAHEQLRSGTTAVAQLMQAAGQEIRVSAAVRGDGLKERIAWQLERLEMAFSRKISRGTGVLATIGSTAPFVGLFGTVWGIMNSFIGISNAHTTNLAVVAPGIAQALLATALGLIAAIPAVMIYNVLARQTAHYRALLGDASAQLMRLVSRDLDRAKLSPMTQAAE
jgi:biopolymer transport protein ExbB